MKSRMKGTNKKHYNGRAKENDPSSCSNNVRSENGIPKENPPSGSHAKTEVTGRSLKEANSNVSSFRTLLQSQKGEGEAHPRYLTSSRTQHSTVDVLHQEKHEEESIQVFVRVRPLNSMEKAKHSYSILDCPGTREVVVKERSNSNVTKTFTFDRAFGPQSKQLEVYKVVVAPLLEKVIQGYNCTVFAYGQTGTGKTFTMEGERSEQSLNWSEDPMAGIVPRALGQLFDELRQQQAEFTIRVSFLELYNEELYDLLAPVEGSKLKNLRMFEDPNRKNSVTISGLEEVIVQSKHEVYQIMEKGSERRKTAATLMNASSSRSHTVLSVIVHVKESTMEGEDLLKVGKLNLVDLAGSENIGRSGAVDKRAREAGNINQSLLTLGRVITALVERAPHVPYRESKLTRILKDSLGGTTKTSIIATVSPAHINVEETLSTLEYAHRAKNITNQPTVNQRLTKHLVMSHYTEEIERLRRDLAASREKNGVWVDKENYEAQEAKLLSLQQELQSSSTYIKSLNENIEKCQADVAAKDAELQDVKDDNETLKTILDETRARLAAVEESLRKERMAKEEQAHLVERHVLTERNLQQEAKVLMCTADEVTSNIERLWTKLERKRHVEQTNLEAGKRLKKEIADQLNDISNNIDEFRKDHATFCAEQRLKLDQFLEEQEKMALEFQDGSKKNYDNLQQVCKQATELVLKQSEALLQLESENRDEINSKCQQSLEILQAVVHKVVRVDLTDVQSKVMATQSGIRDIAESFKSQMASQSNALSRFMEHSLKNLEKISEQVNMLANGQSQSNSALSVALADHQKLANEFGSAMEMKIKDVLEGISAIAAQAADYRAQTKEQFHVMSSNIQKSEEQLKHHCSSVTRVVDKDKAEAQKLHSSYQKGVKAFTSEIDNKATVLVQGTEEASQKINEISEEVDQLGHREETIIADTRTILERGQGDFKSRVEQFRTQFDALEQEREKNVELLTASSTSFKDNILERETTLIGEMREGLSHHCVQVFEWSEGQRSQVYQQAGKVREFWDSTYLVDQPTGATPHRQAYTYPKTLSATSPHDRIIGRFRAARRYDDDEDRENF